MPAATDSAARTPGKRREALDEVTILFCGDSGDGMQLSGTRMATTSAVYGNDVSTLPDYPAEIRAPAGSLGGVSAFQLHIAAHDIQTPGDGTDVLVAMNPAALKIYLARLVAGGILIVDRDAFTQRSLTKAGYAGNPLDDPGLAGRYRLHALPVTTLTLEATAALELKRSARVRCKNFFALGLVCWLYDRPLAQSLGWIAHKFARVPEVAEANRLALQAGYHYGETSEAFPVRWQVARATLAPGTYRLIDGNQATALGLVTAAHLAGKPLVYSSYPITPASEILHNLSRWKHMDVRPIQAEDEIAAMGAAIGAAYGGALAATGTSGPGVCLKSEALNLAVMLELPLVIINVQRAGPSTGMPTKTEQADLLQALFGRHGESPIPVLAPASPAECFSLAIEAARIAVRHMTPVFLLSEGFLANSSEPWRIPALQELAPIPVHHPHTAAGFQPYARDPGTLARPWALPGTPGLEHRLGGLEKQPLSGAVSYAPADHEAMCRERAGKLARVADTLPDAVPEGAADARLLVIGWGGSYGAIRTAVQRQVAAGARVAHVHLRHLNPFPANLGRLIRRHERVLVPELNNGQLALLLRARYLVDALPFSKLQGRPFSAAEIEARIRELLAA